MATTTPKFDQLLSPKETAAAFGVDPKTLVRWAESGKLDPIRTLGGHRRYRESQVVALLRGEEPIRS